MTVRVEEAATMGTRGSGVPQAERDKLCKSANTAISLLQLGKTSDVAATFTSHATGWSGQHVFEIFAKDAGDKCKHEKWKTRHQEKMMKAQMKTRQNRKPDKNDFDRDTISYFDDVSIVLVWTLVAQ